MKKTLFALTIAFVLTVGARAQDSEYGALENFYEANPDLANASQYTGRLVNPNYLLIDWNRHGEMDLRMTSNGFVRLGVSEWEHPNYVNGYYFGGPPRKAQAIAYAQAIGADVIIYSVATTQDDQTQHWVSFYAKVGSEVRRAAPTNSAINIYGAEGRGGISDDLAIAEAHLQAAWDRLPAWKKNQIRPSQRSWIVEKDAATPARRLEMVNERTAWLLQQG